MKKGFTLIELLVVVLIIGILSAIALPQYQKAVKRARVAEQIALVNAVYPAAEACFLANGDVTNCQTGNLEVSATCQKPLFGGSNCSINVSNVTKEEYHPGLRVRILNSDVTGAGKGSCQIVKTRDEIACVGNGTFGTCSSWCKEYGFTKTCSSTYRGMLYISDSSSQPTPLCL